MKKISKLSLSKIGKDRFIIAIIMGLLLFVIAYPVDATKKGGNVKTQSQQSTQTVEREGKQVLTYGNDAYYKEDMIKQLENILSYMDGVGKVKALVYLETNGEKMTLKDGPYTRNNTIETDSEGGTRNTSEAKNEEETVYTTDESGKQVPFIVKEIAPEIRGVMVVCQGGGNQMVKENITQAIQALFGIDENKIKVVKMKEN